MQGLRRVPLQSTLRRVPNLPNSAAGALSDGLAQQAIVFSMIADLEPQNSSLDINA